MNPEACTLAKLALATLNAQAAYFQTRSRPDLGKAKALEHRLREECRRVLEAESLPPPYLPPEPPFFPE